MTRPTVAMIVAACLLAGCPRKLQTPDTPPVATPAPVATTAVRLAPSTAPVATPHADLGVITGTLTVPSQLLGTYSSKLVGPGGSSVLPVGAGNIVSAGAGNIVAAGAGNFHLFDVEDAPLANATVYLADAGGSQIPGIDPVLSDANGKYTIPNVPAGYSFVVSADRATNDDKIASFRTLARSSALGATANIDAASTMVSGAVLRDQHGSDLGTVNAATFQAARESTASHLDQASLPDFTSRTDVAAKMDVLIGKVAELKSSVDQLKTDLQDIKQTLAQIQAQLAAQQGRTPSGPGPTPIPAGPRATPTPFRPAGTPGPGTGTPPPGGQTPPPTSGPNTRPSFPPGCPAPPSPPAAGQPPPQGPMPTPPAVYPSGCPTWPPPPNGGQPPPGGQQPPPGGQQPPPGGQQPPPGGQQPPPGGP